MVVCFEGVLFSGNANNGANAGFAYANTNNSPSNANANISSQLCLNNYNKTDTLPLGKKSSFKKVLVGLLVEDSEKEKQMKRIGNLYSKIISLENLRLADINARKGKLNSYGVFVHDKNKDNNIIALHNLLKNKEYKTSDYHIFKIYEPKERDIYQLPYFPDRIVHHAVMQILEPIWMSVFTSDTFACIKKRGIHGASIKVKRALKDINNTTYCLKLDIKKFYPSIDHAILKQIIRKKIKDNDLLLLFDNIIDSAEGVPIGNYLSQYFANLYLAYFDHYIKEDKNVKYYFRYADDIVILHKDKEYLHTLFNDISVYLKNNLNLIIKSNYQIFPVKSRGIDFCGYVFYHTHTKLRKRIKKRFCKRLAMLRKNKNIDEKQLRQQICSYTGWEKHCNSINLLNTILKKKTYENKFKLQTGNIF